MSKMPYIDYTKYFYNINSEFIKFQGPNDDETAFIFELELPVATHTCPCCGEETTKIKDYHWRKVILGNQVNCNGKVLPVLARYHQRRYICKYCGKAFNEHNDFIKRYKQISATAIHRMEELFLKSITFSQIAKQIGVSVTSAIRAFSTINIPRPTSLPVVLSIDEFRGNASTHKFQVILADPDNKKVVDILPARSSRELQEYFLSFSKAQRAQVKYLVMDMSSFFRSILQQLFPHATIVADRFHIDRLVGWSLENVRKREQHELQKHSRMLKNSRKIFRKAVHTLTEMELIKLEEICRVSTDLRKAYALRWAFQRLFHSYGRESIQAALFSFLELVKVSQLKEFHNLLSSFKSWNHEVVNAFLLPFSNGFTEGCNNKIKVLKRISYGIKNFDRFRNRILLIMQKPVPLAA